jgi:cytochrome c553
MHHQRRRESNNKYRREQRAAARAVGTIKRYGTPKAKKRQSKIAYQKRRLAIIERMGGACEACHHADHRVLQLHHRNGGGREERRRKGWRYHLDMARMTALELRKAFRLLCANCHQVEHYEAGQNPTEPRQGIQSPVG